MTFNKDAKKGGIKQENRVLSGKTKRRAKLNVNHILKIKIKTGWA